MSSPVEAQSQPLTLERFSSWPSARMEVAVSESGTRAAIERIPVEVLERIAELLPPSTRKNDCLSLVRVCKQWYGPAQRELFSFVVLEGEEHGLQVLRTLQDNAAAVGSLRLIVRKLCLLVGSDDQRGPPAIPTAAEQQAAIAADAVAAALDNALAHLANTAGTEGPAFVVYQNLLERRNRRLQATAQPVAPVQFDGPAPLTWGTAQMILQRSLAIQTLTLKLPRTQTLSESAVTTLCQAKLLRKLDIAGQIRFQQLAAVLVANPLLKDLEVTYMKPEAAAPPVQLAQPTPAPMTDASAPAQAGTAGAATIAPNTGTTAGSAANPIDLDDESDGTATPTGPLVPAPEPFVTAGSLGSMHLTSLSLSHCSMNGEELLELFSASKESLRVLNIAHLGGVTRVGFKTALRSVGKDLQVLSLQKITFVISPTLDLLPANINLLDDLPTICPRLEELTIATPKICCEQRFLTTVVPALFLTQLGLDYISSTITPQTLLEMIAALPAGRMETLSLGQEMAYLSTPEVFRACDEIGIVLLGSSCA